MGGAGGGSELEWLGGTKVEEHPAVLEIPLGETGGVA